jgi:hypothetical protein
MAEALFVAAGGGGDVIAAAVIARALGLSRGDAIIATLAWERLLIDPVPGPRSPSDFQGLSALGQQNVEILPTSAPKAPGTSTLPRLRSELGHRLALLDPRRGAAGLAEQLGDLEALLTGLRSVFLVDVGGDVLASGKESGLRSPLADALTLAAVAGLNTPVEVLVAGPGLDGELTPNEVISRLHALGGVQRLSVSEPEALSALGILEWHPSEATALVVAAALGVEGTVEIRDAGTQLSLSPAGAMVWSLPTATASKATLAESLFDTTSFADAEEALLERLGWTELDYERSKAKKAGARSVGITTVDDALLQAVHGFEATASARGTQFTTFRRIAEAVGVPRAHGQLRDSLVRHFPDQDRPPLWQVVDRYR